MKIIELVIDGFKSYSQRTVISGWDRTFNAVTGLNGSGKSNILDSICFVLGITNMSTVRAQNLQDLIYKRGQAGVTKASVTIVFDNSDKSTSPIGFEEYAQISVTRQIVMGGTSKYLINGHRAQQTTVQNLFQSVGLNINNPNFIIMQGRITKVLNMKAAEILAMIEEAAGTRMFEDRKEKAVKTMAKKEMKVVEIEGLLREEIEPKLDKLRGEKRAWLDYQKTQSELERLTRVVVAADYVRAGEKMKNASQEHEAKRAKVTHLEENAVKLRREIENLDEDSQRVRAVREKEMRKGGRFQAIEAQVKELSHELVRLATVLDLKQSSVAEEEQKKKEVTKTVKSLEKQVSDKKAGLEKLQSQWNSAKAEHDSQNSEVEKKEELLSTLQTGVASREGQESGYQGQLQEARARLTATSTEQEQAKLKISHLEKRIKEEEPRAKKAREQNADLLKDLEVLRKDAQKLENNLQRLGFEPGREQKMREHEVTLQKSIRELSRQADELKRKVANVDFHFSDPSPNFDRTRVKGLVAQLFTLDKDKSMAGTALEICAGGRLYNVVVDTAETGTQLLQNGKLKKRVTIIPLNKISAFRASAEKVGAAQRIAPGKVDLALSLIGYEDEVSAAMDYVFGTTLICQDAETAKKVTFDQAVRLKSVTLEGDVYDPSGTLSGGSSPNSSGVLVILQKLNEVTKELQKHQSELQQLHETMRQERAKLADIKSVKQELDLKTHEIKLAEEQISGNSSSSIIQAIEEMKATIVHLRQDMADAKTREVEASKDVKRIEKDMEDFSKNKGSKLKELEKSIAELKKSLTKTSGAIKSLQKELQDAKIDCEQAEGDLNAAVEQLAEVNATIETQKAELETLRQEEASVKSNHDMAQGELVDEQAKLTGFDDELRELEQAKSKKSKQIAEEALEAQKLGHAVDKAQRDAQAAAQLVAALEREHDWIEDNKDQFGRAGSPYDFHGKNLAESRATLKNVTERFQGMKKKINPKVMPMIDSVEKKEASLKNMLRTVIRDKKKIEETISTLDEYKKEALIKTWRTVTEDFGNIFSDLLPGNNTAKLVPLDDNLERIQEGLEVKVCLGKVWKQSLAELSGGQRSLIALSLILALLQFKPAPMYILDEVDAALDLSHTQNIGRIIKTRFQGSQFIVVSLKDGMFQNANRVFRTRFSEGTSVVSVMTPGEIKG
ncbi:structural maintenance-chromosome 2 [Cladophialophora yegresii CBS 114405]|uniref:Structural maintenance of chromosomes protein n=1 Tax=Cladophialophora yegresii CBS 114405 TaxID=1182544 RepID=W9WHP5_9EURO|nr:structural maintenance-chromosome 2 [Cladophialophora yegresii CBS 114405]EXJ58024.1 structural maintenance-chromosome 2 [Cladophialophora yegresii CBS 114405]